MLAMKRFMVKFIGTDAGKPTWQQQQQLKSDPSGGTDVVFVSPNRTLKGQWPICHACGKKHKGRWELCDQITGKVRANIGKLIAAGTFNNKSSSSTSGGNTVIPRTSGGGRSAKQKRGTSNAVVKEEDSAEKNRDR